MKLKFCDVPPSYLSKSSSGGRMGLAERRNLPSTSMVSAACPPTSTLAGLMVARTVTSSSARGEDVARSMNTPMNANSARSLFTPSNLPVLAGTLQLPELCLASLLLELALAVFERLQNAHGVLFGELLQLFARERRHG